MADLFTTLSRSIFSRPLELFLHVLLLGKAAQTSMLTGKQYEYPLFEEPFYKQPAKNQDALKYKFGVIQYGEPPVN